MLCNNDSCVNYQCKIKHSGAIKLAEISKQRQTEEAADLRDEICGYKMGFYSPIDEIIKQKVND